MVQCHHNKNKPIVSYWKSSDPCRKIGVLSSRLTDINIIETKNLTEDFVKFCVDNRNKIFLHIIINGMGGTVLEPQIPTVRQMFEMMRKLIDAGFPQKQILVVVKPILPNDNGLRALKLLLRVFTEYKLLRLRFVRFKVLTYTQLDNGRFVVSNRNITSRPSTKSIMCYLTKTDSFWRDYYKLLDDYKSIISIDSNEEALIGVRELMCFGYNNSFNGEKIINYERGNKHKPIVNVISEKNAVRCSNRCLLCSHKN